MKNPKLKITQRDLPHWELDGSVYFITFNTWEKLELTPAARQIVLDACLFFHGKRYQIFVLVVMPDHVHMLIQPLPKKAGSNPQAGNNNNGLQAGNDNNDSQAGNNNNDSQAGNNNNDSQAGNNNNDSQAGSLCHRSLSHSSQSEQEYWSVSSIMHSIKSYSAKQIPQVMPHIGKVWQSERFDRIVRNDQELANIWQYIRQNPVKAKLANTPETYPFFWQETKLTT